jgi:TonB family protein
MKDGLVWWMALSTAACCPLVPCDRVRPAAPAHQLVEQLPVVTATSPDLSLAGRLSDEVVAYLSTVTKRIDAHVNLYRSIPKPGGVLHFSVSADGSVQDIAVIRSSGHQDIDIALQRAIADASPFSEPPEGRTTFGIEVVIETDGARPPVTPGGL